MLDRFEIGGLGFFGATKGHQAGAQKFPALEVIGIFKQAVRQVLYRAVKGRVAVGVIVAGLTGGHDFIRTAGDGPVAKVGTAKVKIKADAASKQKQGKNRNRGAQA